MTSEHSQSSAVFSAWTEEVFDPDAMSSLKDKIVFLLTYVLAPLGILTPLMQGTHPSTSRKKFLKAVQFVLIIWFPVFCLVGIWPTLDQYLPLAARSTSFPIIINSFNKITLCGIALNLFWLPFLFMAYIHICNTRETLRSVEKLIGHKVWAEEYTFNLLEDLIKRTAGKRAKWFIVRFLANLADDRISHVDGDCSYLLTTDSQGTWHVCRYSKFLSENMDHAEGSVRWLVDPGDFFGILLPELMGYIIASCAVDRFGLPNIAFDDDPTSFNDAYRQIARKAAESFSKDENSVLTELHSAWGSSLINFKEHLEKKQYDALWKSFHGCVIHPLTTLGIQLLNNGYTPEEQTVLNSYKALHKKYIKHVFPHLEAFRRSDVADKKRVILLWSDTETESDTQWIDGAIRKSLEKHFSQWNTAYLRVANKELLSLVLKLFEYLSGDDKAISVCSFKGTLSIENVAFDIGIYDYQFVVRSRRKVLNGDTQTSTGSAQANPYEQRIVDWVYMSQGVAPSRLSQFPAWYSDAKAKVNSDTQPDAKLDDRTLDVISLGASALFEDRDRVVLYNYQTFRGTFLTCVDSVLKGWPSEESP